MSQPGLLIAHPLQPHRTSDLLRDERRLEPRIIGGGAPVRLRPFHPDDANTIARHLEELRHAVAQSVRLHVVRVDRHLIVRRVGGRVRGTERRVSLEGHLVLCLDDLRRARRSAASGVPTTAGGELKVGVALRMWSNRFSDVGNGALAGRCHDGLELPGGSNGLLLALAHDREIVGAPNDPDESRQAADRGFVDARERRARERRLHVPRVHHAGQLHVHRPLRAIRPPSAECRSAAAAVPTA